MKIYMMSIGMEVWTLVEQGYDVQNKKTRINFGNMERI
jgi:hypothetical protein